MLNTSGLLFTLNADGSAEIGYEDYGVDFLVEQTMRLCII